MGSDGIASFDAAREARAYHGTALCRVGGMPIHSERRMAVLVGIR